ncbi:hypothetical protein MLPF_2678 [Mycobacterium lepromatosis]|nr:hypothetical protein [Mycobacterium lepromatosis]UKN42839.1 hypothetical protein MLPF_2678 [Mycobacterium lepromatosis]
MHGLYGTDGRRHYFEEILSGQVVVKRKPLAEWMYAVAVLLVHAV